MLRISWLNNLRGRYTVSRTSKHRARATRPKPPQCLAIEQCEARLLLTLPDITEGMTESEITDAWDDAADAAEDELTDALSDFSDTADDMQTQFDAIGTAMTSGINGAIAIQETQDGLAFAALDAQVLIIDAAFDATVGPERDDYADDLQTFEDDYNDAAGDASDQFATDSAIANDTLNDELATAGTTYDSDVGGLQSIYNGIETTQRGILDTANTDAENDFNDDMDDANDQLTLDNTAADTFFTSSLSPFATVRDTNIAGLDTIYASDVAAAAAVRDSVVLLYSITFDPNIEITNPVLLSALQSARDTYLGAVSTAQQDYQDDLDAALADLNDDVADANDWFADEMADNDDTLASSRQAAQSFYDSTLTTPRANRATAEQTARDNFDDAKEIADNDQQSRDDIAHSNHQGLITQADDDYTDAVDLATTDYENYATARTATFQATVSARTTLYQQQRDGYFATFDTAMANAQSNFDRDVAAAKQVYADAKRGFADTRDDQIATAGDDFNRAVRGLADGRNAVYDAFWVVAANTMMLNMMTGGTLDYTPLYENQQKYEIAVAEQGVYYTFYTSSARVQFNANERPAATALAKKIADYAEVQIIVQANAAETLAHNLANAQEVYQRDIANLDAVYEIDMQTQFVDLAKDVAVAEYIRAYDYAAAGRQLTIDLSISEWTHTYDVAPLRETYDMAMADAAHTFALAENAAFETLQNDRAVAEATWIQSAADDAETRDNMIHADQADWIRDQYQAYVDFVGAWGTAYLAYVPVLVLVQSTEFISANGGTPDAIAVATAWNAYTVAVAYAEVARATNTAAEWQSFGNLEATFFQISADMKSAANTAHDYSVAAALVVRVADEALAQHTYDDEVADAARDFAHGEATEFRTRTEEEADDDDTFVQAMAWFAEWYDQDLADAAYDYAIDFWDRHLPNFTVETNAERDRFKDEQTELKNLIKSKATNERNAQIAAAGFKRTAARDGADQDQRAALDAARKEAAKVMKAAFAHLAATRARPLSSFEQAAMLRIDTWGIVTWFADTLHWAWNEGLDDAVNFVTGWADELTGGGHAWVRQRLGIDSGVDYNSNAYAAGQVVGTVHMFMLGGAAGSVAHVGRAYTAARIITAAATLSSGLQAANNIKNGNGTFWDYLALAPGVGAAAGRMTRGLGIFRCFVGDTPVVLREADNVAIAAAGTSDGPVAESDGSQATFVILAAFSVSAGLLGKQALDHRKRRYDSATNGRRAPDYELNDPHRCELPSGPPPDKDADRLPILSPTEFDELFDQLLTGNAPIDRPSFTSARRGSSDPAASPTEGLLSHEASESQTNTALLDAPNKESPMFAISKSPLATPTTQRTRPSKLGLAWMWGCLLLAGGLLWNGLAGNPRDEYALAAVQQKPTTTVPAPAKYVTKLISDIRVGERVLARNPEVTDAERAEAIEPVPATWRHVSLLMTKPDGSDLRIEMLRPVEWLEVHAVSQIDLQTPGWLVRDGLLLDSARWEEGLIGRTIDLDLPEMGASGPAKVLSVQPCPTIEPNSNNGRQLVTGTFAHSSGDVLDLHISGEPVPIGSTANHPFWSEDRQAFVPAGQLEEGEHLRRADGTITQLIHVDLHRDPSVVVYNLEVNLEHVYFVGRNGVLVHNQYLIRFGKGPETLESLTEQSAAALASGRFPHGVSTTLSSSPARAGARGAMMRDVAEHFPVHPTPTVRFPNHQTVELPQPITQGVVDLFNSLFH